MWRCCNSVAGSYSKVAMTPKAIATSTARKVGGSRSKGPSQFPVNGKVLEEAASLNVSMEALILTEKEAEGFFFGDPGQLPPGVQSGLWWAKHLRCSP